ncbi:hypothetical protein RHOFW510R12_00170 [Rhodanobacter sp. FW510-R12]|nr:hypothetical protein RHOFW104R8_04075 [Rhodanobacter sp. FW104-R8]KZC28375.1 hypothetical protein RhoFW510T8_11725 [Rhodanobacter sp. FW510-T8]KZC32751.1 hypothetical protein RhoFW510R10_11245 [Rhodanobacter sp. FW510-R10]
MASLGASAATTPPLEVYAAGSLTGVMKPIIRQYTAATGQAVTILHGPAGLLRERIEKGADADVYLSANMAHPQRLAAAGRGTPAVVFARNSLCLTTRHDIGLTPANVLDKLLQPSIRIGTSTPVADPGGDYAWAWFAKAETVRPGARKLLEAKARKMVGGSIPAAVPAKPPSGKELLLLQEKVDVFFGYCSSRGTVPDSELVVVKLPAELQLPIDYGMTVLFHSADPARQARADRFALYLMSPAAQRELVPFGFKPVTETATH